MSDDHLSEQQQQQAKRAAMAGQWRTPPLPAFSMARTAAGPTTTSSSSSHTTTTTTTLPPVPQVSVSNLPGTTEDYAKALQDAYIQGAEAAAKLAANRQQDVRYSPPSQQQQQQQQHQPSPTNPPATTLTGSIVMTSAYSCPDLAEPPSAPPVRMAPIAPVPPPVATPATFSPPRTMSLPDMTQYAAQQEDDKRQKRLARNRASARLRRLRKKNLVDAYEQEVGSLQSTLAALQAHRWGTADHAGALADALSMDRGQQVLDEAADRKREAASLLAQQLQWVAMLEDVLLEDRVLHELATTETMENPELAQLAATLQLSPSQRESIVESQRGWQEEWEALQTVKASLVALQENEWLWNESVGSVAEQFMNILHKNQVSKFLLWADQNADEMDSLDIVHAAEGVPSGPVFSFGMESHPEGHHDE